MHYLWDPSPFPFLPMPCLCHQLNNAGRGPYSHCWTCHTSAFLWQQPNTMWQWPSFAPLEKHSIAGEFHQFKATIAVGLTLSITIGPWSNQPVTTFISLGASPKEFKIACIVLSSLFLGPPYLFHIMVDDGFDSFSIGGFHHQCDCFSLPNLCPMPEDLLVVVEGSQSGYGHHLGRGRLTDSSHRNKPVPKTRRKLSAKKKLNLKICLHLW